MSAPGSQHSRHYDVAIVGGGPIGAGLACALSGHGLKLALLDAQPQPQLRPGYDERSLALAYGSRQILATLGLWQSLDATPIHSVHVSEAGQPGVVRLHRRDHGVEALGYVVIASGLGQALAQRLADAGDITLWSPATLTQVSTHPDAVSMLIERGAGGGSESLSARLLVAADGADSKVRQQLGIATRRRDYRQSAIVANLTPELAHRNVAFERFTPSGPLALLPLSGGRCAMVLTVWSRDLDAVMALSDPALLDLVQARFGDRLGRLLKIGRRSAYPTQLVAIAEPSQVRPRLAVIGNAAHTLHPVAGQGVNLGLRDVATLAELIVDAHRRGQDIGAIAVLSRYQHWRQADQRAAIWFTDGLVRLFSNSLPPLRIARGVGLNMLDILPPAKRLLARQAMGLGGRLPRLMLGKQLA